MTWDSLSIPWQAALEQAWEAHCAGDLPIGAVITGPQGEILARGRNRIFSNKAPRGQIAGDTLAHAELNALLALQADQPTRHGCTLYTTLEPCPLCLGALYISSVHRLVYAARDPWAGSANLLGTTPYLSHKPIHTSGPPDPRLEVILIGWLVENDLVRYGEEVLQSNYLRRWREILPLGIELGITLYHSQELRQMQSTGMEISEIVNRIVSRVK
jgi:tRNA(adenine34) deaminase